MDARIILGGQAPDILGAMDRGRVAAEGQINLNRQNALAALYREQGAGIAAGNQESLNALAAFDPMAAQGVQQNILSMDQTRQNMAFSAEEMQMRRDEGKRKAAEALAAQAATLTAEQLAAEQEALTKGLSGAAFFYQNKDRAGYDKFLTENGMDPAEFPFDAFPAHAAMFEGALEAFETFAPKTVDPNDRYKVVGSTLMDLGAEGGPAPVAQGQIAEEVVMGPDGKPITIKGPPGTSAKFTEGQSKDNVYATRAEGALQALEGPADPSDPASGPLADSLASLGDRAAESIPLVGNYFTGETYQTARTAGDEFLQAILRKDTGAAITEPEQRLYGVTYLPQPGDTPRRLAYKKEARARAVEAIKAGMNAAQIEAMARADAAVVERLEADGAAPATGDAPANKPATEMSDDEFLKAMGLE